MKKLFVLLALFLAQALIAAPAIAQVSDVSITKTDGVTSVNAGATTTYTITAANSGPNGTTATIRDTFPASITAVSWTCSSAGFASCSATSGSGNINQTVSLPSGGSVTYTAVATISASASGTLSNTATVTGIDSDPNPGNNSATDTDTIIAQPVATISVSPASVAEDGAPDLVFTITLDTAPATGFNVFYTLAGTADNGVDYAPIGTNAVNFPAGTTTRTITINPTADTTIEADETVSISLNASSGYTVGAPSSATGTILNDDLPNLTINDVSVTEGNSGTTSATFTVSLSAPAGPGGVSFNIGTSNGTATAGSDYVTNSLTGQTIPAGSSSYTFTVQVNGDTAAESNESFFVNVTSVTGAVTVDGQGVGTITNDDTALPVVSLTGPGALVEGNSGLGFSTWVFTLSAPAAADVAVGYQTVDGTATGGVDYGALSGTLTIPAGSTQVSLNVYRIGDTTDEPDETYSLQMTSVSANATLSATTTVSATLLDDDEPPTVSTGNISVTEGNSGTTNAVFTITLSQASGKTATANYRTNDGTATSPADFTAIAAGSVTFAPGETSKDVTVVVNGDTAVEPNETFTFQILSGSNLSPGTLTGTATITNDDVASADLSITKTDGISSVTAGNTVTYTITASNAGPGATTATVADTFPASLSAISWTCVGAGGGTCTASGSGNIADAVSLPSGASVTYTATATLAISATGTLSNTATVAGAVTDPNPANNSATDTDTIIAAIPNLSINDVVVTEGNSGTTNATFTVSLSLPAPPGGTTFNIATADGTAAAGSDYSATTLTSQTIPAGSTSYSFTVPVTGDLLNEDNETFFVNVTGVTNANVTDGQGLGTITNDDSVPTVSINDATVVEGNSGTTAAVFTISLSAPSGKTVQIGYASADDTAVSPADYAATSGSLTFAPGETSKTVTVQVVGETLPETNETFGLNIVSGTNAQPGAKLNGIGTITNDDVPVTVGPASLPGGTAGTAYNQTVTASGGSGSYSFAVTSGALPTGVTLSPSGVLSGTPTVTGTFNFTVTATDTSTAPGPYSGSRAYSVVIAAPTITITPTTLPAASAASAYTQTLTASGGTPSYNYAITAGALPAGLTLTPGGVLSGTPTASGSFNITVTATDALGFTGSQAYTLVVNAPVLTVTPATLPAADMGLPYSQPLSTTGGIAPYAYAITAGALPTGLTLNPTTGLISGTPTVSGSFSVTIRVTDSTTGTPGLTSVTYVLAVAARPDPAADAEVRGLNDGQIAITRRFSQTQIDNIGQRLHDLHEGNGPTFRNSVRFAQTSQGCMSRYFNPDQAACVRGDNGPMLAVGADGSEGGSAADPSGTPGGSTGIWSAGTIRFGQRDAQSGRPSYDFESTGITVGIDHRISEGFAAGLAFGYADESQKVGDNGSQISATAKSIAVYGSNRISGGLFLDWIGGYQSIDFGLRRFVTSTGLLVDSDRDGNQWFGSINLTYDLRGKNSRFSPYLRVDTVHGTLGAYAEGSGSLFDLAYLDQGVDYTSVALGARYERVFPLGRNGAMTPRIRVEYEYDLERSGTAKVGYVDQAPGQFSTIAGYGFSRDRVLLGAGLELAPSPAWAVDLDYSYRTGSDALGDNSFRLGLRINF